MNHYNYQRKSCILRMLLYFSFFIFSTYAFRPYNNFDFKNPIVIGGYHYTSIKTIPGKYIFCVHGICVEDETGYYPSSIASPTITFGTKIKESDNLYSNDSKEIIEFFKKNMPTTLSVDYNELTDALQLVNKLSGMNLYICWSPKSTYLIFKWNSKIDGSIFLGRNLEKINLSEEFDGQSIKSFISKISTRKILRIGCDETGTNTTFAKSLEVNKYVWSSLGGEKVWMRGSCKIYADRKIVMKFLGNPSSVVFNFTAKYDMKYKIYRGVTPFVWNSGMYELKMDNYSSTVELYSQPQTGKRLIWSNQGDIIQKLSADQPILRSSFPISKVNFRIFKFNPKDERHKMVLVIPGIEDIVNLKCIGSGKASFDCTVDVLPLLNNKLDVVNSMGMFFAENDSERAYTTMFNLMWLKPGNQDSLTLCESYLEANVKSDVFKCPNSAYMANTSRTRYRKSTLPVNADYNCYADMFGKLDSAQSKTCCYDKSSGLLVYGQDQRSKAGGSYSWTFSPLFDGARHSLYDRQPIEACCVRLSPANSSLCEQIWLKRHSFELDYMQNSDFRGDVFGDPHMIPFKSEFKYSFINNGEFVLTMDNLFQLQGRFFYDIYFKNFTYLQAVAFSIIKSNYFILPVPESSSPTLWSISINNKPFMKYLFTPFEDNSMLILQGENRNVLEIYLKSPLSIFMRLERTILDLQNMIYMNIQLLIPGKEKDTKGILGNTKRNENSSTLFPYKSANPLPESPTEEDLYRFVKSWQINQQTTIFKYKSSAISNLLNSNNSILEIPHSVNGSDCFCGTDIFCKIDKDQFPDLKVYEKTHAVYVDRMQADSDVISAKSVPSQCRHPIVRGVALSSSNYSEGSVLTIKHCLIPDMKRMYETLTFNCINGIWRLHPKIESDQLCKFPATISNVWKVVVASVGALILLIFVIIIIIVYFYRKRTIQDPNLNTITKSTDALSPKESIPMGTVYDNFEANDEYLTYATVNKASG